jgi:Rad52/22 family double-strand break repair protein
MSEMSSAQRETLLRPLNPARVLRDAKGMSHLPAYDVVAHLSRVFGFEGWDKEILSLELVSAERVQYKKNEQVREGWDVTYRCTMRLSIYDISPMSSFVPRVERRIKVIEDGATGSANHMPNKGDAHDFAMKNAISYAIKRCAKDLGDQFGLSLYNNGSVAPLLVKVVPYDLLAPVDPPDDTVPEPLSMGNDERQLELVQELDLDDPRHDF